VLQDKPGKPLRCIEQVLRDKGVSEGNPAISRQDSSGSLLCDALSACSACTAVNTDDNSLRRPQGQTCYLGAFGFANLHNHAAAAYAVRGTAEAGQLKPAHGPERSGSCGRQHDCWCDADHTALQARLLIETLTPAAYFYELCKIGCELVRLSATVQALRCLGSAADSELRSALLAG